MSDSLFTVLDDGRFLPTGHSRGPWSPDALHGGPVAALVGQVAEDALAETGRAAQVPVRLTLDLERPVPLAPLTVSSEVVRPGRKVQTVAVAVHDEEGRRLARGAVLAIRREHLALPDDLIRPDDPVPPGPDSALADGKDWVFPEGPEAFHKDATEHRAVAGAFGAPGPVTDWIRLTVPVVADREPGPFQRVLAAADFLNGVSNVLSPMEWTFINPDLTVTLHRMPVGEWVAIDAVTRLGDGGTGTAEADLFDERGRIGRAVQTLLFESR